MSYSLPWWTKALVGVVFVLIGLFLVHSWWDAAISLDHARQEQRILHSRIALLRGLLNQTARNLNRKQVEGIAQSLEKDHIVKRENDKMIIDDVVFIFKGETVVDFHFLDEGKTSIP